MRRDRLALTALAIVGAFILAGFGVVDGDAVIGFVAGALGVPSLSDAARPNHEPSTRGG